MEKAIHIFKLFFIFKQVLENEVSEEDWPNFKNLSLEKFLKQCGDIPLQFAEPGASQTFSFVHDAVRVTVTYTGADFNGHPKLSVVFDRARS